jgi:dUTP pyrophosphatase
MKIKAREITTGCKFEVIKKGDWIDLHAAEDIELSSPQAGVQYEKDGKKFRDVVFEDKLIPLGVAVALAPGYEAVVVPRSSSFRNFNIIQPNSPGVIDYTYRGTYDEWSLPVVALGPVHIKRGDRICQFRIQLSQKATIWQKIKWLFTSKIKFVWVDSLEDTSRGGFGTTGK